MSGERILILDDNAKQLDLLGKYLGKYGYKTLLCGKLTEALATLKERDDIRIIMCASSGTAQNLQSNYDTLFTHAPELPVFLFAPREYAASMPNHHEHIELPLQLPALVQRIKNTLRTLRYSGRTQPNRSAEPTQQNGTASSNEQPHAARDRRPMHQQSRHHESSRREPIAPPAPVAPPVAVEPAPIVVETAPTPASKPQREKPAAKIPPAAAKREAKTPREARPRREREATVAVADTEAPAPTPILAPPVEVAQKENAGAVAAAAPKEKAKRTRKKNPVDVASEIEPIFPRNSLPLSPSLLETVSKKTDSLRGPKLTEVLETFIFPSVKLTLDRQREVLLVEGEIISLSASEYILMKYMLENRNRVLSREEILRDSQALNPETSPRNVDTAIRKLRRKLGDDERDQPLIQTIWGVGYLLQDKSKRKPRS